MKGNLKDKRIYRFMLAAAALVFVVLNFNTVYDVIGTLVGVTAPLLAGVAIAYILNIPLMKFEKIYFPKSKNKFVAKTRRGVCLILSIAVIIGIALAVIAVVIPQITIAFSVALEGLPALIEDIEQWIIANREIFPSIAEFVLEQVGQINIPAVLSSAGSYLTSGIGNIFDSSISIISSITSSLFNSFMAITFAIFLVFAKETILRQLTKVQKAYIKPRTIKTTNYVLETLNESFHSYIIGQCTEAVILGCLCTVGMMIFRFPYAGAVGMFVGLTALIPIVGAYLGSILGAVLILLSDPSKVIFFIIFIIVLQQLEGNIIYPKVVGNTIGLPGVWVLAAVVVGGGLGGVLGMILSVPIVSAVYKLVSYYTNERLETPHPEVSVDYDFKANNS